ncbi:hypothetical protein JCM18918_2126 [Cutibacterium acnes JCM 18918]|nr:hypothetical protein JCM18918_2126 [Cutibacterium acnes JCM 18918]
MIYIDQKIGVVMRKTVFFRRFLGYCVSLVDPIKYFASSWKSWYSQSSGLSSPR